MTFTSKTTELLSVPQWRQIFLCQEVWLLCSTEVTGTTGVPACKAGVGTQVRVFNCS